VFFAQNVVGHRLPGQNSTPDFIVFSKYNGMAILKMKRPVIQDAAHLITLPE
jgi:hypothetical protein